MIYVAYGKLVTRPGNTQKEQIMWFYQLQRIAV